MVVVVWDMIDVYCFFFYDFDDLIMDCLFIFVVVVVVFVVFDLFVCGVMLWMCV